MLVVTTTAAVEAKLDVSPGSHGNNAYVASGTPVSPNTAVEIQIDTLPPLPVPLRKQADECRFGAGLVVFIVASCVGLTFGLGFLHNPYSGARGLSQLALAVVVSLITGEALVAMAALSVVLFGDPGVVKRSKATCFPMPAQVRAWIEAGAPPGGVTKNVVDDTGRSYCVRCLVWRDPHDGGGSGGGRRGGGSGRGVRVSGRPTSCCQRITTVLCAVPCISLFTTKNYRPFHHCSTCQRCVRGHDHHCFFYGRCITATNMNAFIIVGAMGMLGGVTSMTAVCMSVGANFVPAFAASATSATSATNAANITRE